MSSDVPVIAFSQGDPAGVGPEILCKLLARPSSSRTWRPLVVAERAAVAALPAEIRGSAGERFVEVEGEAERDWLAGMAVDAIALVDPVGEARTVRFGESGPADAKGALTAVDRAVDLVQRGVADALVTLPVSKESIARHVRTDFRGHTEHIAARAGLTRYGRDYLMAFLAPDLQVALLTTHIPLQEVVSGLSQQRVVEALELLAGQVSGRIAVAGLNPHAGEGGLMGDEEETILRPAIAAARARDIPVAGPESADSLFARARRGEFDWVLALYHDQGLIAVKTAAFGLATNWTLGLPFLRTSVDHGTAFGIAGRGEADAGPLKKVVETTLGLIAGRLPFSAS